MNSYVRLDIIQGWRQRTEGLWNGCHELQELFKVEFDGYSRCSLDIKLYEYNEDFESVAQNLALLRQRYKVPRERFAIGLFPFSWGVGHGVPSYAKALARYGFNVQICVPSDGIFWTDDFLFGFLGNWRALFGDSRIHFPDNVLHTIPFCQKQNRPSGRGIATTQTMEPMTTLPYIHTEMDDAAEWHLKSLESAKSLIREYLPSREAPDAAPTVEKVEKKLETQLSAIKEDSNGKK